MLNGLPEQVRKNPRFSFYMDTSRLSFRVKSKVGPEKGCPSLIILYARAIVKPTVGPERQIEGVLINLILDS